MIRRINFSSIIEKDAKKQKTSKETAAPRLQWQSLVVNLRQAHQELNVVIDLINIAQAANLPTSLKQRAELVDEIWHAVGDHGSYIDWYVKRTVLGGIYSMSELYMVTDHSPASLKMEKEDLEAKLNQEQLQGHQLKEEQRLKTYNLQILDCSAIVRKHWQVGF